MLNRMNYGDRDLPLTGVSERGEFLSPASEWRSSGESPRERAGLECRECLSPGLKGDGRPRDPSLSARSDFSSSRESSRSCSSLSLSFLVGTNAEG